MCLQWSKLAESGSKAGIAINKAIVFVFCFLFFKAAMMFFLLLCVCGYEGEKEDSMAVQGIGVG
jgi:hypothetical protein